MNLLALETATDACSAALAVNGDFLERFEIAPRGHSQRILPMMDELLMEAGITLAEVDALAFGRGPGAFTGMRIAVGVAQGIAFGADLPVVAVSSLATLAQGARAQQVLVAVDARMNEVYWGAYRRNSDGLMELCGEESVLSPDQVPAPDEGAWAAVGSAWLTYEDKLAARCLGRISGIDPVALPHAQDVALLGIAAYEAGEAVSAEQALPVYLRDETAWKKMAT